MAIIDSSKKSVLSLYAEPYGADATTKVFESSLRIDTARFDVANGNRAIGIRASTFFGRCTYEGGYGDELWLFVDKKPTLQPVLSNFPMSQYQHQWLSGSPCGGNDELTGATHTVNLSLIATNIRSSHGYHDFFVNANLSSENENMTFKPQDERAVVGRLVFDGEQYQDMTKLNIEKLFQKRQRTYEANYKREAQKK